MQGGDSNLGALLPPAISAILGYITLLGTDLAELLEYTVLPPYHKDMPKSRALNIFAKGLARIDAEPRHKKSCIHLAVATGNIAQNGLELEYDKREETDADSLNDEPDFEPTDLPS